jgi:hypothetical protein
MILDARRSTQRPGRRRADPASCGGARGREDGAVRVGRRAQHRRLRVADEAGALRSLRRATAEAAARDRLRSRRRLAPVRHRVGAADRRTIRTTRSSSLRGPDGAAAGRQRAARPRRDAGRRLVPARARARAAVACPSCSRCRRTRRGSRRADRADVHARRDPRLLPRRGAPPPFETWSDWEELVDTFVRSGVATGYMALHWDIRPHPALGTLEIRAPDQPTSLERTAAFVELLHGLCRWALEAAAARAAVARGSTMQNRWAASRFGPRAQLIHPTNAAPLLRASCTASSSS